MRVGTLLQISSKERLEMGREAAAEARRVRSSQFLILLFGALAFHARFRGRHMRLRAQGWRSSWLQRHRWARCARHATTKTIHHCLSASAAFHCFGRLILRERCPLGWEALKDGRSLLEFVGLRPVVLSSLRPRRCQAPASYAGRCDGAQMFAGSSGVAPPSSGGARLPFCLGRDLCCVFSG